MILLSILLLSISSIQSKNLRLRRYAENVLPDYNKHEQTISKHYQELNPSFSKHTFDWDDEIGGTASTSGDQQVYEPPPYGKSWGPARSYGGKTTTEPLYYDPEDPFDGAFNASLKHYTFFKGKWIPKPTNPFQGAAYLPSGRSKHPDPMHPQFGFVPVNYVNPNWNPHPFRLGTPIDVQKSNQLHDLSGLSGSPMIPTQVPFPITEGAQQHPVYADKYYPGIQPGHTKLSYPTPLRSKYKYKSPSWFDSINTL